MLKRFPLAKPFFTQDELIEVQSVLDSGWVSQGPKCQEFENLAKEYLNSRCTPVAVSSCTTALHLSLAALGITRGDEVIVADFSFPATGLSVLHTGATPVFCDVEQHTYNIDPNKIEPLITNKTKAIIPVHTFGNPCKMDEIMSIAKYHGLFVIEDAACAFGAEYKNKPTGLWGDIGCYSFHARKGITTGEGGMVVSSSDSLTKTIREMATFGVDRTYGSKHRPVFKTIGYNYKMSDIAAAIGVAQMNKLPQLINCRRALAKHYIELLDVDFIITPQYLTLFSKHIYQSFVGTTPDRDRMMKQLGKAGIETGIGTYAQHTQPVFQSEQKCNTSERLFRQTISLPMYCGLAESNIDTIVTEIKKCR